MYLLKVDISAPFQQDKVVSIFVNNNNVIASVISHSVSCAAYNA